MLVIIITLRAFRIIASKKFSGWGIAVQVKLYIIKRLLNTTWHVIRINLEGRAEWKKKKQKKIKETVLLFLIFVRYVLYYIYICFCRK